MSEADQLRQEVFECQLCANIPAFRRPSPESPFYKFPPIIGAQGRVKLLFVGINPRRTDSNLELHDWLAQSKEAFAQLAMNRQQDGRSYIRSDGDEPHYHWHMAVVKGAFGENTAFESVAAVTELLLCASESEPTMLANGKSPCAERYLARVLKIVQPSVVIAVGSRVRKHLESYFKAENEVPVVRMTHPRELKEMSKARKAEEIQSTIQRVRRALQPAP